jgi:hypothetical protein
MSQKNQPKTHLASPLAKVLGIYQLAGGIVGLGLLFKMAPQLQSPSTSTWVGIGLAALLYSFSLYCGFSLLNKTKAAYNLSLANQVLQVFSFGMAGFAYSYVAGLKAGVGLFFLAEWVFKAQFSVSSFHFSLGNVPGASFVSVNLVALVLIYLLERAKDQQN